MNQSIDIIKNKFNELGCSDFSSPAVPKDIKTRISEFEREHNLRLPDDYKYFLENYGECNFEIDAVYKPTEKTPFVNSQGFQEISFFYGLGTENDLYKILEVYSQRIPTGYIPIADLPGGNLLCIDSNPNSSNYGKIYLWDHENECDGKLDNMYLVANSFSNFISSFEAEKKMDSEDDGIEDFHFDF